MTRLLSDDELLTLRLAISAADRAPNTSKSMIEKARKLFQRLETLEVPDLDAIIDDLSKMERRAEAARSENLPNTQARAHCTGRSGAFRDAKSRVMRDNVKVIG